MLVFIALLMTSCYSTYSVYTGNVHQQAIGKTKNEILKSYGVPNQVISDAAGGEVLVYENYTQTTITGSNSYSEDRSLSNGGVTYRRNGAVIQSESNGRATSSTRTVSQTSIDKTYCNIFINEKGVVYETKANYGDEYEYYLCFDRYKTWLLVGVSCLPILPAIVTVPWAIIAQKKAKKNGEICDSDYFE